MINFGANTVSRIDIIIPIFYLPELYLTIKRCLDSIEKYYPDFNLTTIDDSEGYCPFKCKYKNDGNLGYVRTVNRGLALSEGDVIIIGNDDLEFEKGDLDRFRTIGDGIYSPRDTASGNLETFGSIWGMNRATFEKMGYLSDTFKHFCSDLEYFDRAIKKNVPVVKWHDIVVKHEESATYNKLDKRKLLKQDASRYIIS